MLQKRFRGFAKVVGSPIAKQAETRKSAATEVVEQLLGLFRSDFQRTWKPAAQGAVEEGIADEEHEHDRQEGDRHGAEDHLGLETCAELRFAALHQQADKAADEDETKDEQGGGNETGYGLK